VLGASLLAAACAASASDPVLNTGLDAATQATQSIGTPLAAHPMGQLMMQQAMSRLSPDIRWQFLNKTYENDQYTNVLGKKVRTSCVRFKTTSGFTFSSDPPSFELTNTGLRVEKRINRIHANGLTFKFQLGPCMEHSAGFGVILSDVKVRYRARPVVRVDTEGYCKIAWNEDPDSLTISIGDLNILNVQNDLDKLARDAVREAANRVFKTLFETMRNDLTKISLDVCGNKSGKKR
jgi:hypothetical protein